MGERYGLRQRLGTRGEQDRRRFRHAARDDGLPKAGNTQQARLEERAELHRERKALRVFKRHPDIGMFADGEPLPRKLVQQAGRSEDAAHARRFKAVGKVGRPARPIAHHGRLSGHERPKPREHGCGRSGQHDADALRVPRFCLDEGRQRKSPHDHIPRRECGGAVGKHKPRGSAHGLPECRLHQIPSVRDRKGTRLACGEPRGGRLGGFPGRAEQPRRREDTIPCRAQRFKLLDGLAGNLLQPYADIDERQTVDPQIRGERRRIFDNLHPALFPQDSQYSFPDGLWYVRQGSPVRGLHYGRGQFLRRGTEQEMIRHSERGRHVRIVEGFQRFVERAQPIGLSGQFRFRYRYPHPSARHKEYAVEQQFEHAPGQSLEDIRSRTPRPAERASPEASRPDEYQPYIRNQPAQTVYPPIAAEPFPARTGKPPGGIEKDIPARAQDSGHAFQRLMHPALRRASLPAQIRYGNGSDQSGQRADHRLFDLAFIPEGPRRKARKAHVDKRWVDKCRMVGQEQNRTPIVAGAHGFKPFHLYRIAQPQQPADKRQQRPKTGTMRNRGQGRSRRDRLRKRFFRGLMPPETTHHGQKHAGNAQAENAEDHMPVRGPQQ